MSQSDFTRPSLNIYQKEIINEKYFTTLELCKSDFIADLLEAAEKLNGFLIFQKSIDCLFKGMVKVRLLRGLFIWCLPR
jgi:hypothetical protein